MKLLREVPAAALALIRRFEGFSPTVYADAAGYWTIGVGHRLRDGETFPLGISDQQADDLLRADLGWAMRAVSGFTRVSLTDGQFGALVSLTFNIGSGNFHASTLRMKLNRGDYDGAADEFPKWRRAGGSIWPGLVRRRAAERMLFQG